jgi:hypothetical protein
LRLSFVQNPYHLREQTRIHGGRREDYIHSPGAFEVTQPEGFAEGYRDVSRAKGLSPEKLPSLPSSLNLLRINLEKIESLNAKFATHGYDNKADHRFSGTID